MTAESSLEQFKNRLRLADIVGRYVKLTRQGREHRGLCPFHQEKTPSFHVVEDKGFYHCFGCGAHGDAISFIGEMEGLSFAEALRRLADITGIEPPELKSNEPQIDPGLVDASTAAMRYFQSQLEDAADPTARDYLKQRGISSVSQEKFKLGYAGGERQGLRKWLSERGVGDAVAVEAGLLIAPEGGAEPFDRFRDRLMIPIEDLRGRVVGFGGRALKSQKAKYVNSPESPIFHKGSLLYNLKQASNPSRRNERLIVVEGYLDVIALDEAGLEETVAPLGTAITEEQLARLWRLCPRPTICLDGDRAGRAAALRLANRALGTIESGQSLEFLILPEGEDPDSLVRAQGPNAITGLIRNAVPLSRLIWLEEVNSKPCETPEQFADLRRRLLNYVGATNDPGLKQALKDQFYTLLDSRRPKRNFRDGAKGTFGKKPMGGQASQAAWEGSGRLQSTLNDPEMLRGCRLIGYFLQDAELLSRHSEALAEVNLQNPAIEAVRQEILNWCASCETLDAEQLRHHLTVHGHDRTVTLALGAAAKFEPEGFDEIERVLSDLGAAAARQRAIQEFVSEIESGSFDSADVTRQALDKLVNATDDDKVDGH